MRVPSLRHRSPGVLLLALLLLSGALPAFGQKPIDFTLKNIEGNEIRLSDHLGKDVILIDFWATWCVPCVKELSHFQKFHEKYKDKGLVILALAEDGPESVAMVKPFAKRYGYTFTVLLDTESRVLALYNPRVTLPYTLLIDRSGRIAKVHQGYSIGDEIKLEEEVLALLEPKEQAAAGGVSVAVNESFLYRGFSDKDYVRITRGGRESQIINRLDLTVTSGSFLAGGRADADVDFTPYRGNFSLAKKFLEYNGRNFQARVGDYYMTVGRGLAFSLLKTFEKEGLEYIIDTTVSGGKAAVTAGAFTAEAMGGWIERNRDRFADEEPVRDAVYGGTLGWTAKGVGNLKFNFVGSSLEKGSDLGTKSMSMGSVVIDLPNIKDKAKLYGEFLLLRKQKHYYTDTISGHAVYVESAVLLKNLTFVFEFKDYKNLDFEYNRPPLLESESIPVVASQFANSSKDITGGAVRIDYYLPKASLLFFAKYTRLDDKPGPDPRMIDHLFAGVEKKFKETGWLTVLAGMREERSSSLIFYYTAGRTIHGQANLSYPLSDRWSIEADIEAKSFRGTLDFVGQSLDYMDLRSYFSICWSPTFIATLFYDQTTDPEIRTYRDKRDWWGGQLEIKLSQANFLRIFVGDNKGGVKCAGGVCKFFPPFSGVRIDSVVRF